MAPVHLAVFDCDGTLVDSQHAIVAAMVTAFEAHDLPAPPALAVRRVVGLPLGEAIARLLPPGQDAEQDKGLEKLTESYKQAFFELRRRADHQEPLYPGARATLQALAAADVRLGVATGKSRRGLIATLDRHGLRERFAVLKTADDGPGKPNPDILCDAMAELGATPETTVVIGDTSFDMVMAARAGALSIGVAWGYHTTEELTGSGAARIAETYYELPALIAGLWGIAL